MSSLGMVYRKLAVAEAKRGRTAAALAAAREMVRLDPYDGIGHAFLGALLASSGADREVALGHLELAVCLGHASAECLANLCKVRLDSGDLDGAVDAGEAAVEVGPNDLHAWLNLAVAAYSAQRFERAAEALGHYLQARPINGPLHQARGDCLLRLGRYGEALRHFQAGCQMLPPGETRDTASRQAARLRIVVQSGL